MKSQSLLDTLNRVLAFASRHPHLTLEQLFTLLEKKGPLFLIIVFSVPLCLPLQIPGISVPFGLALALLGIQLSLHKNAWLPQWILKKRLSSHHVKSFVKKTIKCVIWTQRFIRPRWQHLTATAARRTLSGCLICLLALLLALPLPVPITNLLFAIPILCLTLSLLEEDGLFWIVSVFLSLFCLLIFGLFVWIGCAALF